MRLRRSDKYREPHKLNMPAMIDIVMLLLIFFMCTSNFVQPENRMQAALSRVEQGVGQQEYMDSVEIELISEADQLRIFCDGTLCDGWAGLRENLRIRREISDMDVIVRGGAGVPFENMVKAVDISHLLGFSKVGFSAKGPGE
ncbi:protein TolR [Anaerohalosphaera lusitana]|uniref:Protein TolR n=1 Tax=Anaerohalosphaera lusitana TaxID=1936003 RepID=A0A1U9NNL9_9BACT|nr:biopolymer transporter ExbD [Anaerohalosphaera lusitana]AQT69503.1 protein TolR [Anaerohalosphaera lusitana]